MKQCGNVLIGPLGAAATLLAGCDRVIVDPKGDVDRDALAILLVIVPVIATTFLLAWKSRALHTGGLFGFSIAYLSCILFILLVDFIRAYGGM